MTGTAAPRAGAQNAPRSPSLASARELAERVAAKPVVSYLAIIALQLHVMWKVWVYRDTTFGDTSAYYLDATLWIHHLQDDIVWSPLYTDTLGTIAAIIHPVWTAMMVHRILIVFGAVIVVLAVARRFLPASVALLVAAWWAIVPANFSVTYEVHLSDVIAFGAALVVVGRNPSRARLGACFGILLGAALLLRNELIISVLVLLVGIVLYELRSVDRPPLRRYLRSYGLPLLAVAVAFSFAYERSVLQGSSAAAAFDAKQTLNFCQVYAFNFQQRHPSAFTGNPFTQCEPLIQHTFGESTPTLVDATFANPRAVGAFVGYNLALLPLGMQVSMFGATSGSVTPGFESYPMDAWYPTLLSAIWIAVLLAGVLCLRREREYWRGTWLRGRGWLVLVLGGLAMTALIVAATERPRPEYIYGLTLACMIGTGVAVTAIARRAGLSSNRLGWISGLLALALIIAWPAYYSQTTRPLHDALVRLAPVERQLQRPGSVLITDAYNGEICAYTALDPWHMCSSPAWATVFAELASGHSAAAVLRAQGATVIYADVNVADALASVLAAPQKAGWRVTAHGGSGANSWSVLVRS